MSYMPSYAKALRVAGCILLNLFVVGAVMYRSIADIAWAEEFPSREIKVIVSQAPGGAADIIARIFADKVGKILGVPVLVVNNTAGGGVAGALSVIQAKPDGYTIYYTSPGTIVTKELLTPNLPYRHTDFTSICLLIVAPMAIFVRQDAPWKSLNELVDYGKKNPGQLRVSVAAGGGVIQTLTDLFMSTAGIEMTTIPTKGGASQSAALMGGHAELSTDAVASAVNFLRAGRIRALVSTHKVPGFPMIKTFADEGYSEVTLRMSHGIFGSKALPKLIVAKLTEAFQKASSDPSLREQLGQLLIIPDYRNPEETARLLVSEREVTTSMLKKSGLIK